MAFGKADTRDRATSIIGVALIHALLGYVLLYGLGASIPARIGNSMDVFDVLPDPPPPPPEAIKPLRQQAPRKAGAAAPPNLTSRATDIVAPPPIVTLVVRQPVVVAPIANIGVERSSGAAPVAGPGTGSGGQGNGTGSGDGGDGDGGGGGGSPYEHIKGRIRYSDYPRAARDAGISGIVYVRYVVGVDGRASGCRVTRSSGNADLDSTTCRLLQERYRFRPARNAQGRKIATLVENEDHHWETYSVPPVEDDEP